LKSAHAPVGRDPFRLLEADIFHYYYESSGPFRSITELDNHDLEKVIGKIDATTSIHHSRLTQFKGYVAHRRTVERTMRCQFAERGGKPVRAHPYYFILGNEPSYLDESPDARSNGCREIRINPRLLNPDIVSFTFCDSLVAFPFPPFFSAEGYNFPFAAKPFHGKTYHFGELESVLKTHGHPDSPENNFLPFPAFIEVQLWDEMDGFRK
jgi:hypothetical protein